MALAKEMLLPINFSHYYLSVTTPVNLLLLWVSSVQGYTYLYLLSVNAYVYDCLYKKHIYIIHSALLCLS